MNDPHPEVVQLLLREGIIDGAAVKQALDRVHALPAMDRAAESFPGALLIAELVDLGALTVDQAQDAWVRAEPATTLPSGAVRPIPGLPASISSGVADPMAGVRAGLTLGDPAPGDSDSYDSDDDSAPHVPTPVSGQSASVSPPSPSTVSTGVQPLHATWDERDLVRMHAAMVVVVVAFVCGALGLVGTALGELRIDHDIWYWFERLVEGPVAIGWTLTPWVAACGLFGTLIVPHPRGRGWAGAAALCSAMVIAFKERYEIRTADLLEYGAIEVVWHFGIASAVWGLAALAFATVFVFHLLRDLNDTTGVHLIAMTTIVFAVVITMLAFGAPGWAVTANGALACGLLGIAADRVRSSLAKQRSARFGSPPT